METSQIYAEEECHSCESGWTMYIGSPPSYGDHSSSSPTFSEEEDDDELVIDKDSYDENSDDSMASDASSGPTRYCMLHHRARGTTEAVDGNKTSKRVGVDDDEPKVSWSSNYIIAPKMMKKKMKKKNGEKEECTVHSAKGGVADSKMKRKKSWKLAG